MEGAPCGAEEKGMNDHCASAWKIVRFLILFTVSSPGFLSIAAAGKIVHYEKGSQKASRPDFSRAVVCLDMPGDSVPRMLSRLRSLGDGPQDFSEPGQPCDTSGPYIRIYPMAQNQGAVSGAGWSSGYGSRGGYSSYGSFSGNLYTVQVNVDLVRPGDSTITLGSAQVTTQAGYGSESISSYGWRGGSTFASQGVTPERAALKSALNACGIRLFNHGNWIKKAIRQLWYCDVTITWIPGANETVQVAYAKK